MRFWLVCAHPCVRHQVQREMPNQLASNHNELPNRSAPSSPFAYPNTYLILSTYMLMSAFVSFMIRYDSHTGSIPVTNPWMDLHNRPAPHIPPNSNSDKENTEQFAPQRTLGHTPGKKLLCMALLAAISSSDGTPELILASNQALK